MKAKTQRENIARMLLVVCAETFGVSIFENISSIGRRVSGSLLFPSTNSIVF